VLSEDFSSGVPPLGWAHVNNNASSTVGWVPDGTGRAWHEDEVSSLGTADNSLVSPAFDLVGVASPSLTFSGETNWASYLANHPNSFGDGASTMEISTDGGVTWTVVWTDTSLVNGSYSPSVDLSAYDGMTGLTLGVHFFGTYAQEWWVDNIVVDGGLGLNYSITGLAGGGTATLTVAGATPSGGVLIGYSLAGAGPTMTPFGLVDMSMPISQLPTLTANGSGTASMTTGIPAQASGVTLYTQAADLSSSALTNSLAEVIL